MRNPNGFGTIKKLSGNRRRPFAFVKTINGKQKPLGYFPTWLEAKVFQLDYNLQNNQPPSDPLTFDLCYQQWFNSHTNNHDLSSTTITNYQNAFQHCRSIHHLALHEIKYYHLQSIIDSMRANNLSYSSAKKVKSLLNMVLDFAFINDSLDKNYAKLIKLGKNKPVYPHKIFTRYQINKVWGSLDSPFADSILILLYTGLRVSEMLNLTKSNVNLKQKTIRIVKAKTKAGIRIVPIHEAIFPLVKARYATSHKYLIEENNNKLTYGRYRKLFGKVTPNHTPHDTRHTTATLLDNSGANRNCIRAILGHSGGDVTDSVYTHKGLRQLRKAINLIK